MRMYVIVIVVVLLVALVAVLLVLADRATVVVRRARKRRAAGERLAAAVARADARAEEWNRARTAAAEVSGALTTVIPAILIEDHEPRHVALASGP
jgi:hypothetical protein